MHHRKQMFPYNRRCQTSSRIPRSPRRLGIPRSIRSSSPFAIASSSAAAKTKRRLAVPLRIPFIYHFIYGEQQYCEIEILYSGNEAAIFPGFKCYLGTTEASIRACYFPSHRRARRCFANTVCNLAISLVARSM